MGMPATLTRRLDTFAFGAIAHRLWTGTLPKAVATEQTYLYEAALSDGAIQLSDELPTAYRWLIRKSFSRNPEDRPDDGLLERLFAPPVEEAHPTSKAVNGLSRYMRTEHKLPTR